MAGLAGGAWITSLYLHKIKNKLFIYAVVELALGLFAFIFHDSFLFVNEYLFSSLPNSNISPMTFAYLKWILATLLILPQSILLGTTFPLISSGLLQLKNNALANGKTFSLLYFNNSIGAAIGALVSGFILIQAYGLPGTIITAGIINIFVAVSIILLLKITDRAGTSSSVTTKHLPVVKDHIYKLMLATAFFTGVASFCYEIAWIRMLTLVLGATTHAFEIMISTFILGLALGSLFIKRYIDKLSNPIKTLAQIQILMAVSALMTLIFYDKMFDLMVLSLESFTKTNSGYTLHLFSNHFFSLLLMLPATFFAGMTLPLITNILYSKQKNGEVIGHVYAINTLGSIVGIIFAINIMPLVQLKGVINLGALIDIALGMVLLGFIYLKTNKTKLLMYLVPLIILFPLINHTSVFNPLKVASSVFRSGGFRELQQAKNLFHKDGKLSTVDITRYPSGTITLTTNGKPDASINLYGVTPTVDESTMVLLGALPYALNPKIKTVANIGMGSGQTVQTLLSYSSIDKVDTIEIESSVIDALPQFKIHSQSARYDKRSNIFIDDAKSFFASSNDKYDLIISEPSNPWVSGTSNLFSTEFYQQIKGNLSGNGIFSQWLQLYEIKLSDLAPVFKSLSENFKNYVVYHSNKTDILIFASNSNNLNQLNIDIFNSPRAKSLLNRVKIKSIDDLNSRHIGSKELLQPLFDSFGEKATSDYHPKLDYAAAKSLYMLESAIELYELNNFIFPVSKYLESEHKLTKSRVTNDNYFPLNASINHAHNILELFNNSKLKNTSKKMNKAAYLLLTNSNCSLNQYSEQAIINSLYVLAKETLPYLQKQKQKLLWKLIEKRICHTKYSSNVQNWISLHKANALQKHDFALKTAKQILSVNNIILNKEKTDYLATSILYGYLKANDIASAKLLWESYSKSQTSKELIPLSMRLLMSHINK